MPETEKGPTAAETLKTLQRTEDKTFRGLSSRSTKRRLLEDPGEVARKHPKNEGYHIRWSQDAKTASRKDDGYEVIPDDEGGCRQGDQCLMRLKQDAANARNEAVEHANQAALNIDDREHRAIAAEASAATGGARSAKQFISTDD